ncbi:hypothetical protein ACOI1H_25820, partial [Loktanella sp. DJP18]|uniref:hypothetical protein n=1 Tax=Loktanella sp. DJP18 TaxID=3409788 RepID=UPI003BB64327
SVIHLVMLIGIAPWVAVINPFWHSVQISQHDITIRTWRKHLRIPLSRISQVAEIKKRVRTISFKALYLKYIDDGAEKTVTLPSGLMYKDILLIDALIDVVEANDRRILALVAKNDASARLEAVAFQYPVAILANPAPKIAIALFILAQIVRIGLEVSA